MNQIVRADNFDAFKQEVLHPDRVASLYASLPAHVKPERFDRNLSIALRQHPKLLECDPLAVFNEVSKAAALGLLLDPQLGEAYLITGWNHRERRLEPQLRAGYRGLIKLGRQSGEIAMIYAHEICANDEVEMDLGVEKRLVHKPSLLTDRGDIIAYYAVVKFKDGVNDFEPMSIKQIREIRDRSDGWKAFKEGRVKSTPWSTDEGEMSKKTVMRRLMKRLPQSPELADALQLDDSDYRDLRDVTPSGNGSGLSARLAQSKATALPSPEAAGGFSMKHIERELEPVSQPATAREASTAGGANGGGSYVNAPAADRNPPADRSLESEGRVQTRGGSGIDVSVTSPGGEQPGTDSQISPGTIPAGGTEDEPKPTPSPSPAGSSSTNLMTRDHFTSYSLALGRAMKVENLGKIGSQYGAKIVEALGGEPGIGDVAVVKKIFKLHEERIGGKLEMSILADEVETMLDRHFGGSA